MASPDASTARRPRRPNLFVVGAPKCGTTWLYYHLRQHPEVFGPSTEPPDFGQKEIHYFGEDLEFRHGRGAETVDDYLEFFRDASSERWVCEASVWYLYSKSAPREMLEFSPDARAIIMLRDPVEMIRSLHVQLQYNGYEDVPDLEQAIEAEADRRAGRRIPSLANRVASLFYSDHGFLADHVQRYLDAFGEDRVKIFLLKDLKRDQARVYREALEFLEVDPTFTPEFTVINGTTKARSRLVTAALSKPWVRAMMVPYRTRPRILRTLRDWNTLPAEKPPMNADLRRSLAARFEDDTARLERIIGRDLSHWTRVDS